MLHKWTFAVFANAGKHWLTISALQGPRGDRGPAGFPGSVGSSVSHSSPTQWWINFFTGAQWQGPIPLHYFWRNVSQELNRVGGIDYQIDQLQDWLITRLTGTCSVEFSICCYSNWSGGNCSLFQLKSNFQSTGQRVWPSFLTKLFLNKFLNFKLAGCYFTWFQVLL